MNALIFVLTFVILGAIAGNDVNSRWWERELDRITKGED